MYLSRDTIFSSSRRRQSRFDPRYDRDHTNRSSGPGGRERDRDHTDEPPVDPTKKKFGGRCRLFVGNLSPDVKEEEVRKLAEEHGEVSDCFVSSKGFGFIQLVQ